MEDTEELEKPAVTERLAYSIQESADMLGDAEGAGEAGGTDAAGGDPVAVRQRLDLIILELRRRAQAGIDRGDRLIRQQRHAAATLLYQMT